ncbi:MAG TPA: Tudor-knot domain-containing protein [Polyangiaceae bacterium]
MLRSRRTLLLAALALAVPGCKRPYRVGEHVLVEWEEGKFYPAYVVEAHSTTRYRVHFDGYDSHWDEDVGVDRIRGRIEGPVAPPPPPKKVLRAAGAPTGSAGPGSASNPFRQGDRVRVTWRGSVYPAVVLEVVGKDRVLVHYEGHESAWDETIPLDRVVNRRQ